MKASAEGCYKTKLFIWFKIAYQTTLLVIIGIVFLLLFLMVILN